MGEFLVNKDYSSEINQLRSDIVNYPIELQLIWLMELIVLLTYTKVQGSCRRNRNGNEIFTQRSAIYALGKNYDVGMMTALSALSTFRNDYVHSGRSKAYVTYLHLTSIYRESLYRLAKDLGITLNFGIDLYNTFGVIV